MALLRKAGEQDELIAIRLLASLLQMEESPWFSESESLKWAKRGAELGDAKCMIILALGLLDDNEVESLKWLERAAEQGDVLGKVMYGVAMFFGLGTDRASAEFNSLKKDADAGQPDALYRLGCKYEGGKGVEKNLSEAVKCYQLAAEKNHASAWRRLGHCSLRSTGMKQSFPDAYSLFRRAVEAGESKACGGLAWCYLEG